ncbi:SRPBCC domain-containing protein [Isoptericola sp. NPDC057559]|uniref:SRPBCC family protein n=1 Tax=Isoptericola sp. NPDC057559 TaxID=3346168 RepID=UPI0036C59359
MAATDPEYDVEHTEVLDVPPAAVFAAFTDPDVFARWYGPEGVRTPREEVEIDARVGGVLRFAMTLDADPSFRSAFDGTFTALEPGRLVAAGGAWVGVPGVDGPWASRLRVELAPAGDGTRVVVREGPHPAGSAELGRQSWRSMLPRLARAAA